MIVLGIDPGTAICGYGFVENIDGNIKALHYGAVTTSSKARMQDRLEKIYDSLDTMLKKYQPEAIGIEKLFFGDRQEELSC